MFRKVLRQFRVDLCHGYQTLDVFGAESHKDTEFHDPGHRAVDRQAGLVVFELFFARFHVTQFLGKDHLAGTRL